MRDAEKLQTAGALLADDFAEAIEDLALRSIARKFRDTTKSTGTPADAKIVYFTRKTTYSKRKFYIINLNKLLILYLFLIGLLYIE